MAEVATLAVGLVLNTGSFFAALGTTLNSAASKITSFGLQTSLLISAPFMMLAKVTGQYAMDFDQEMRNVNATLRLSEEEFQALRQSVIELSMDSRSTAIDIAQSLRLVAAAAGEEFDAWELVVIATHAAAAAYTTTAKTSQYLIAMMRAYGLSLEDAEELMDRGIWLTQKSAISFDELANEIGVVAPISAMAGISMEEMFGALRELQKGLGNTSYAFVSYQRIVQKILDPTKDMQKVFKAAGYESGLAALEALGLRGVIQLLTRAVDGDIAKMVEMTGLIYAWRGLIVLMQDDANGLTESVNLMAEGFDGAMETARTQQYMALNSVLQLLKNTFKAFGLSLWEVPMPALVALTKWLQKAMLNFMKLDDHIKQWIIIVVAAGAALGPILLYFGRLIALGSTLVSIVLNPLTLALAAVAFAAYKWITARYHIENFQDAIVALSDIATRALDWISDRLVGFVDLIGQMATWGAKAIGAFAQGIISGFGLVVQAINYVAGGIAALLGPGSPPAALPNIVKWGQMAIDEFLQGMTMADFSVLDELGGIIESHLRVLEWESAEELSAALIRARVALARVIAEASTGGEASAEAWAALRREIGTSVEGLEEYLRARIAVAQAENALAQAELERKRILAQLENESHEMQMRHKEELRRADAKVQAAEEALQKFQEQTAEIPERFTRGRRRQLEAELRAVQKEREAIKERQEIERDQFEWRKQQIQETLDAQVAAAQRQRDLMKEQADWLAEAIKQREKIIGLYQKEKEEAADFQLPEDFVPPDALDGVKDLKNAFDKARESAQGLFGTLRAFWWGLTGMGDDLMTQKELLADMTPEEKKMFMAGKKIHEAWEKFAEILGRVRDALSPIVDAFKKIFAGEIGGTDWAAILEEEGLGGVLDRILDSIIEWIEKSWPKIKAKFREWKDTFWAWLEETVLPQVADKLNLLLTSIEDWLAKPETQARLVLFGYMVGGLLIDAFFLLLTSGDTIARIELGFKILLYTLAERLYDSARQSAWLLALGFVTGMSEKLDPAWQAFKLLVAAKFDDLVKSIVKWFTDLNDDVDIALLDFFTRVVAWFVKLYNKIVGESIIPDLIRDVVNEFAKLPGKILARIEQGLIDIYNRFVRLKNDIVGVLGDMVSEGLAKLAEWVDGIIAAGLRLYDDLVGHSIIPDMVRDINMSLENLNPMLGAMTGLTPAPVPALAGGGFAGQLVIQNYWDSSISSKDRAELSAMMETTVYSALDKMYGGAG